MEIDEFDWAREQTNVAMANNDVVAVAKVILAARQLPLHPDKWKNWDNFLGIHHAMRLCEKGDPILDAGACRDPNSPSAFLPSLQKLGFTNLHGCNLDEIGDTIENGVYYTHQNIEKTLYPQDYFKFVGCFSTIEHGVDWRKYYAEMSRILRPGGYLFTSFDYWQDSIWTYPGTAFGAPIKVFNSNEVMQMCIYAHGCGLTPVKPPDLACHEKIVQWMGMDYTFFNLLMRKR